MKTTSYILKAALLSSAIAVLSACSFAPPPPPLTPLQIQTMQTRTFQANKKATFQAVVTTLQNEGYTIQTSDMQAGTVNVIGPSHSQTQGETDTTIFHIPVHICTDGDCGDSKHKANQITSHSIGNVTVTSVTPKSTSVRLSFTNKIVTSGGQGQDSENDKRILDSKFYQGLFNAVRQSLFVGSSLH